MLTAEAALQPRPLPPLRGDPDDKAGGAYLRRPFGSQQDEQVVVEGISFDEAEVILHREIKAKANAKQNDEYAELLLRAWAHLLFNLSQASGSAVALSPHAFGLKVNNHVGHG